MNLPFVPAVFAKILAATLTLVVIGFGIALAVEGKIETRDIVGALVSAPIFAYMVHLWITMGKDW
ncbi:MAG: hypothetical protein HOP29_05310 [Phycisphaerales bacterium]|nr:hypothetical protein [Phycisphaerales bacterium]